MKTTIAVLALVTSVALATELPGHDPVERVIPQTDIAAVGELVAVSKERTASDNLLTVTISLSRKIWGQIPSNTVTAVYKEFIPKLPDKPGLNVDFINYTGSGVEFQAKAGEEYICFFQKKGSSLALLRLEPLANEAAIRNLLLEKLKKDAPTKPPTVR
jgi:hypothetical protein